jgi:hypothetical protein
VHGIAEATGFAQGSRVGCSGQRPAAAVLDGTTFFDLGEVFDDTGSLIDAFSNTDPNEPSGVATLAIPAPSGALLVASGGADVAELPQHDGRRTGAGSVASPRTSLGFSCSLVATRE